MDIENAKQLSYENMRRIYKAHLKTQLSEDKIFEQLDKKLEELNNFEEKLRTLMQ